MGRFHRNLFRISGGGGNEAILNIVLFHTDVIMAKIVYLIVFKCLHFNRFLIIGFVYFIGGGGMINILFN